MSPRKYTLGRREQTVEETRRRIVEATFACHSEKGILATSYEDIARKADVALATVYRHFPTVNDLVTGCGAHVLRIIAPPSASVFNGARTRNERLAVYIDEIFAFWGRAHMLETAIRDAPYVPAIQDFLDEIDKLVTYLGGMALGDDASSEDLTYLLTFTDFYVWKAFHARGLSTEAPRIITEIVHSQIGERAIVHEQERGKP